MVEQIEVVLAHLCRVNLRLTSLLVRESFNLSDIWILYLFRSELFLDIAIAAQITINLAGSLASGLDCHYYRLRSIDAVAGSKDSFH